MTSAEVLVDAFTRIREVVHEAVTGLSADQLAFRVDSEANSIAWLVWHLTRVQDDHVADVAGIEQVWTAQDWLRRFGLPFPPEDIGYGHDSDEVAAVRVASAELLTGYHDAVCAQTIEFVRSVTDDDLPVVVDTSWSPPVTLGVRLVSVLADDLQHAGQAAFIRGLLQRRS
ncbi:mycothiol transferase [Saccharopolyspora sp. 5N708]|uniref:mycothiol transferase n=1 Tax=Saccharopolyspora sp. 5N708 TaxID=3457424 RepID=UPI003FD0A606